MNIDHAYLEKVHEFVKNIAQVSRDPQLWPLSDEDKNHFIRGTIVGAVEIENDPQFKETEFRKNCAFLTNLEKEKQQTKTT